MPKVDQVVVVAMLIFPLGAFSDQQIVLLTKMAKLPVFLLREEMAVVVSLSVTMVVVKISRLWWEIPAPMAPQG